MDWSTSGHEETQLGVWGDVEVFERFIEVFGLDRIPAALPAGRRRQDLQNRAVKRPFE